MIKNIIKKNGEKKEELPEIRPVVDIIEKENEVLLVVEMPGVDKENITVEIDRNELVISGKRYEGVPKGYVPLYQERLNVEYKRAFELSDQIDKNSIAADYENGVLVITLKKVETEQAKKITVN